ncbi:MAG TPA: AAA family ATPase [Pseudonocardiaceae bacterium]|nr:AAA family ATPase [Pseudonocardiaceae bacterium]
MIRNIHLANWRAYEELDLSLTRPVTFFVAPNGVGKTSLVEAVRWGLLGIPDGRGQGRAVRGGQESAMIRLDLSLPGSVDVQVRRSLKRSGATAFEASVDGVTIDESQYHSVLRDAWSAEPGLLDALIFEPVGTGKSSGFPIRDHLAEVFGVRPLLNAATQLQRRRIDIEAEIKSLRNDQSGTDAAIAAASQVIVELESQVEAGAAERRAADKAVINLEAAAARAADWERYRHALRAHSERLRELIANMTTVLDIGDRDPAAVISDGVRDATATLENSLAAKAAAEVRAAVAATAADILGTATDHCPTCLRPLSDDERTAARAAHGDRSDQAKVEIDQHVRETAAARQRVNAITRLGRALSELKAPPEPEAEDPGPETLTALAEARRRAVELAERQGALASQLGQAKRTVADLRQAAQDQSALLAAAREDLIAEVVQNTLNAVADQYATERIEPLTHEIGHRWKLLFGSDGLRLGADGRLSFRHGDLDLELSDLSSGERSTALLVTRLLLTSSVARTSTIWFDEPLEHLDPRRRAAVARILVLAAQADAVGQIVITTYEEELARRLAAIAPDIVALTYARTDHRS